MPNDTYMQTLINFVSGGKPLLADPLSWPNDGRPQQPSGLAVVTADYSSATLNWTKPVAPPLAFVILWDGSESTRLPGTITNVTIGNIPPGLPRLTLTVCAIGGNGSQSAPSNMVTTQTMPLKDNHAVVDFTCAPTADNKNTTCSANVLVPYAFVRIYITNPDTDCVMPAWSTPYNDGHFVCAHYMVEDDTLYVYTGTKPKGTSTLYPWDWTPTGDMQNVELTCSNFACSWNIPIGTDTVDTNYIQIQAEDYGPLTNVFQPCPDHWLLSAPNEGISCVGLMPYDCNGAGLCKTTNVKYCDKAINAIPEPRNANHYTANGDNSE